MTKRIVSFVLAALIFVLLTAGYAIVVRNTAGAVDGAQEAPTGFIH
jgi:hypothetical protein